MVSDYRIQHIGRWEPVTAPLHLQLPIPETLTLRPFLEGYTAFVPGRLIGLYSNFPKSSGLRQMQSRPITAFSARPRTIPASS